MVSDGGGETSHIPPTKRKGFLMERNVNYLFQNKKKNKCLKMENRQETPERRWEIRCTWSGLDRSRITAMKRAAKGMRAQILRTETIARGLGVAGAQGVVNEQRRAETN